MESGITPQERKEMIKYLEEHPINPMYDDECDTLDGNAPEEQLKSRMYQKILDKYPE